MEAKGPKSRGFGLLQFRVVVLVIAASALSARGW
jgi:hypothetical protein